MGAFDGGNAAAQRRWRPRWSAFVVCALVLALPVATHHLYGLDPAAHLQGIRSMAVLGWGEVEEEDAEVPSVAELIERVREQETLWRGVEGYYDREVAPVERVLLSYSRDRELVRRIARALVREARHSGSEPRLLLAVLLVENTRLDPRARSEAGAQGLMQVMPMHLGQWPPCANDLVNVEANICYGARIFAHYLEAERGDVERALLRYNGCARGTRTPDCHRYPYDVFARAGQTITGWPHNYPAGAAAP